MAVLLEPLLQSGNLHSVYGNIFNILSVFRFLSVYQVIIPPPRPCPPHPNFAMCKFWAKYPLICLKFWNLSSGKFCEAHVKIKYRQHRKSLQIFWWHFITSLNSARSFKENELFSSLDSKRQGIYHGLSLHSSTRLKWMYLWKRIWKRTFYNQPRLSSAQLYPKKMDSLKGQCKAFSMDYPHPPQG